MDGNDKAEAEVRVRFGSLPSQTIPFAWAEAMLRKMAEDESTRFGKLLQWAALNSKS
jgi:hypothetical protein